MSRLVWFILGGVVSLIGAGVAGTFMREEEYEETAIETTPTLPPAYSGHYPQVATTKVDQEPGNTVASSCAAQANSLLTTVETA